MSNKNFEPHKCEPFKIKAFKKIFGIIPLSAGVHTINKYYNFSNPYGNRKTKFKPTQGAFLICSCHDEVFVGNFVEVNNGV